MDKDRQSLGFVVVSVISQNSSKMPAKGFLKIILGHQAIITERMENKIHLESWKVDGQAVKDIASLWELNPSRAEERVKNEPNLYSGEMAPAATGGQWRVSLERGFQ